MEAAIEAEMEKRDHRVDRRAGKVVYRRRRTLY